MRTVRTVAELRGALAPVRGKGSSIGLVPTMGAFHDGHLSLMRRARADSDLVVVTLFVNPSQFGEGEDFDHYPRAAERDADLASREGVDFLFAPSLREVYPPGFSTSIEVAGLGETLCGAPGSRGAGHFRAVATVVTKLLNMCQPDVAYFGAKDFQQALVIKRLVRDLDIPVRIEICPTVRDRDGLALSSRNSYLSDLDRRRALSLSRALGAAEEVIRGGATDPRKVVDAARRELEAAGVEIEYLEAVSADDLAPLERIGGDDVLVAIAARVGSARLIDNLVVRPAVTGASTARPERRENVRAMHRQMLKSKIHRATVTDCDLHYAGSITIDPQLMEAADLLPGELVHVLDVDNGERLETYAIEGRRGSGDVQINGAAARLVHRGDLVIVLAYGLYSSEELDEHEPQVVHVNAANEIVRVDADPAAIASSEHEAALLTHRTGSPAKPASVMGGEPRVPDTPPAERPPVTVPQLADMKRLGQPIVMVTTYDYPSAQVAEEAGVDVALVGDTAAMTVLGYDSTVPVSLDEMLVLASAVRRGLRTPLMVGDLPFGSYQRSNEQAIESAIRYMKEAGCDAVKMEMAGVSSGLVDKQESIARTRAIVGAGIPVMGHVGLTPQSASALGGYRTQGRTAREAVQVADDALALQDAGCFAIVFEAVPAAVTETIVGRLDVPVIGIGAGPGTDGQVLVLHDLLGIYEGRAPRFVKRFAEVKREMVRGVQAYAEEVRRRSFPADEHCYRIEPDELERFKEIVAPGRAWEIADAIG